jgi:integrase
MSIYHKCQNCRTEFSIENDACPKCQTTPNRQNPKYRVSVYDRGRRRTLTTNRLGHAREINAQWEADRYGALPVQQQEQPNLTMADIWTRYRDQFAARGKKGGRMDESRWRLQISGTFGRKKPGDILPEHVERWLATLMRVGMAAKTVRHHLELLQRLIRYSRRMGWHQTPDPVAAVEKPRVNNIVVRSLSAAQCKALTDALDLWYTRGIRPAQAVNAIRFLYYTGMRSGEAAKLEWRDVDLQAGSVHLRDPKGGLDQNLPLNRQALTVLLDQRQLIADASTLVFPSPCTGGKRKDLWWTWDKIRGIAGLPIDFRLHDLRHNYATWLASSGKIDLYTLQALLTHKDPRTTQRYAHLLPETLRRGADLFGELVDEAAGAESNLVRVQFAKKG